MIAELFCGAKSRTELHGPEQLTEGLRLLSVDPRTDYHQLARIHREARTRGKTIRKRFDCLIAAVALRTASVLVHCDFPSSRDGTASVLFAPRSR